jgi:hypothetical protein
MIRWLAVTIILGLVPLLIGAAPLPISLEPATPIFGKVVTLTVELPTKDVVSSGLPALGPFAALSAPTVQNTTYRLELLPLRSGIYTLPSLPFQQGHSEHFRTEPLTLEVIDDIPLDATIILPLKPQRSTAPLVRITLFSLAIATGGIALAYATRKHVPVLTPPPLASYSGNDLLAELHRRIMSDDELNTMDRQSWSIRLDAARFSQPEVRMTTARQLLAIYQQETGGQG